MTPQLHRSTLRRRRKCLCFRTVLCAALMTAQTHLTVNAQICFTEQPKTTDGPDGGVRQPVSRMTARKAAESWVDQKLNLFPTVEGRYQKPVMTGITEISTGVTAVAENMCNSFSAMEGICSIVCQIILFAITRQLYCIIQECS